MTEKELVKFFQQADEDGDNQLDFLEFVTAATQKEELLKEQNLKAAFDLFDLDKNGLIEKHELKSVL